MGETAADRMSDGALLVIGPVLALAFVASLFHLGSPLNAPRAVVNLGTSWLSREIFFGSLFALAGAIFALHAVAQDRFSARALCHRLGRSADRSRVHRQHGRWFTWCRLSRPGTPG